MATFHWLSGVNGDFGVASNWDQGSVPSTADTAIIDAPGTYTVTISDLRSVASLVVNDAGAMVSDLATLNVSGALTVTAGTFTLGATGDINGGTLSSTGGAFVWAGGTLSGATYQGTMDLTAIGASLTVANGLTMTGIGGTGVGTINANGGATSLTFAGTQTLDNVVINAGNPAGGATAIDFGDLTLGANVTLNQEGGSTSASSWSIDVGNTLTNNGTIQAGQFNAGADIVVSTLNNNGLISTTSPYAGFTLQGTTIDNAGTISTFGGIGMSGYTTIINTGIINSGGGVAFGSPNMVNNGQINLTGSNTYLAFDGDTTGTGSDLVSGTGTVSIGGTGSQLRFIGSTDFSQGTIDLNGTGLLVQIMQPYPLQVAENVTFGAGAVVNQLGGTASLTVGTPYGGAVTNNGVMNGLAAGGTLAISGYTFTNDGLITSQNGDKVVFSDNVAGTGTLEPISGGIVEIDYVSANAVQFTDTSSATFRLGLGNTFTGTIQGFTNGNTIDLAGITATSASWSNGTLTVNGSGWGMTGPIHLALAGNYAGATFHVASDGILVGPPALSGLAIYSGTNITVTGAPIPTPPHPPAARVYGGQAAILSVAEDSMITAPIATFTDSNGTDTASQLSATISWGDGKTTAGTITGGNGTFSVADGTGHVYADEGLKGTSIAITNAADGVTTTLIGSVTATEADVLSAGAPAALNATVGQALSGIVATFSDSNLATTAADLTASISWGDGTSSTGTISDVNGAITVNGAHTYAAAGHDAIAVTLTDADGTAGAVSNGTATVTAPSGVGTGVSILSVSDAGIGPAGVFTTPNFNANSASTAAIPGTISASSLTTASDATHASSVTTGQTITAGWTSGSTATATFADTWSSTNVQSGVNNASQAYGMQAGPGYANATFDVDLASAGSFSINWSALLSGTGPLASWGNVTNAPIGESGFLNMVVSIDGGLAMQVSPASNVAPTGSFTGTLAAGAHTIDIMDWSNYSGVEFTSTGTLTETLNLTVNGTGITPTPANVYGGTGSGLQTAEESVITAPVATFTDSNTADTASQLSATISWGDGTTTAGTVSGANGSFTIADASGHSYADEGSYATSIAITNASDKITTTLTGSVTATEADAFTAGAAKTAAAVAGVAFSGVVATFTDINMANNANDLTASITWGDGSVSAGTVADVNGAISVSGSHTYAATGTDGISVTLTDADGTASASASASASVASPYSGAGAKVAAVEGKAVTAAVATFTDANSADTAGAFTASINWGDGTSSIGVVTESNGVFSVAAAAGHVYAAEGSFNVTTSVTQTAAAATFALTGSATVAEGDVLSSGALLSISATAGKAFSGTVATFSDSYAGNTPADLTATITWGDGTTSTGIVSDANGAITVSGTHTYAAAGSDAVSVTLKDADGTATATAVGTASVATAVSGPGIYHLTTGQDDLVGTSSNNTFVATSNTLSNGDVIKGGPGVNTLSLSGGGTFNLGLPDTLSGLQIVAAQEGTGSSSQVVTLRENTALTVNVASGPAGSGITIVGAQNKDVINLGKGNDTVILAQGETVNGGGGNAIYQVNQDSIYDTINGGTGGTNTLVVTVGGSQAMGANITGMTAVQLTQKTNFTANNTANMTISGSAAGGDTIQLGAATQSVISGGPNERILASAVNASAQVTGVGAGSVLEITSGGTVALNANTSVPTIKLDATTNLTLSKMSFITTTGSSTHNMITAGATNQTLGAGGSDTLIGFSAGLDTFAGKASNLNGDTIQGFLSSDRVDITDLAFAGATVKAVASGANTLVTVASGTAKSTFTVAGSWSASGFHLASDGANGTVLTHA